MNTKIAANSIFLFLFVFFSIIYYEIVIGIASNEKKSLGQLLEIKNEIGKLND